MLLYPSIFILLKGIYMKVSEEFMNQVGLELERLYDLVWYSTNKKEMKNEEPSRKETRDRVRNKYPINVELIDGSNFLNHQYFLGTLSGIQLTLMIIHNNDSEFIKKNYKFY
jgi:hypothetical protein